MRVVYSKLYLLHFCESSLPGFEHNDRLVGFGGKPDPSCNQLAKTMLLDRGRPEI